MNAPGRLLLAILAVLIPASALAAEPWEFESRQELSAANDEYGSSSVMRVYQRAKELAKKGGPANADQAIRRLRWCLANDPETGPKRDKVRRWKKADYHPYYHLALLFAWKGDWYSAIRCHEQIDENKIRGSAYSVGHARFGESVAVVRARLRVVGYIDEIQAWLGAGVPVRVDPKHRDAAAALESRAGALADRPAGPWRGGQDEEPAALAGELGAGLLAIYAEELARRREIGAALAGAPWSGLLGGAPARPAACNYDGQDLARARDSLYGCAAELEPLLSRAGAAACERLGGAAPVWCGTGFAPAWPQLTAVAGSLGGTAPRPAGSDARAQARPPRQEPPARASSDRATQPSTPRSPTPAPSRPPRQTPSDAGPSTRDVEPAAEPSPPPADTAAPATPVAARDLLRAMLAGLERGSLDRLIAELAAVETEGRLPPEGRDAAICRAGYAYVLYLRAMSAPVDPAAEASARGMLLEQAEEQVRLAARLSPDLLLPESVFSEAFRDYYYAAVADE